MKTVTTPVDAPSRAADAAAFLLACEEATRVGEEQTLTRLREPDTVPLEKDSHEALHDLVEG